MEVVVEPKRPSNAVDTCVTAVYASKLAVVHLR